MLVVMAEVEIDPGNVDALKGPLDAMEKASRAEPGCHEYTFSQEVSDPGKVRIIELWESMDALEAHFKLPHMATFQASLGAHPPKSMSVKVYELGEERALPGSGG